MNYNLGRFKIPETLLFPEPANEVKQILAEITIVESHYDFVSRHFKYLAISASIFPYPCRTGAKPMNYDFNDMYNNYINFYENEFHYGHTGWLPW